MDIIIDVETVPLEPGKHVEIREGKSEDIGALSPITGKIVAIGMKTRITDKIFMSKNEKEILTEFWDCINSLIGENSISKFVGFNTDFDLHFLIVRSIYHNIKTNRIVKNHSIDLRKVVLGYGKKGKLSDYAKLLRLEDKCDGMDGSHIKDKWEKEDFDSIKKYLNQDLEYTYKLYDRVKYIGLI